MLRSRVDLDSLAAARIFHPMIFFRLMASLLNCHQNFQEPSANPLRFWATIWYMLSICDITQYYSSELKAWAKLHGSLSWGGVPSSQGTFFKSGKGGGKRKPSGWAGTENYGLSSLDPTCNSRWDQARFTKAIKP